MPGSTLVDYLNKRIEDYNNYIATHINNVKSCYKFYGKELCERLGVDYEELGRNVEIHDQSKYSEEEFEGFRCYYFPTPEEERNDELRGFRKSKYNAAWLHHLRNNPHHPEYWIYMDEEAKAIRCKPMEKIYIAEMLLDWAALSIFFKSTAYKYWIDTIHDKPLHPESRELVDHCIDLFKEPVNFEALDRG